MIDRHDHAPDDPGVQDESDVRGTQTWLPGFTIGLAIVTLIAAVAVFRYRR